MKLNAIEQIENIKRIVKRWNHFEMDDRKAITEVFNVIAENLVSRGRKKKPKGRRMK